jgi:hypothetical protein
MIKDKKKPSSKILIFQTHVFHDRQELSYAIDVDLEFARRDSRYKVEHIFQSNLMCVKIPVIKETYKAGFLQ